MATGLGKTLLAVLDTERFAAEIGRRPRVVLASPDSLVHRAQEASRRPSILQFLGLMLALSGCYADLSVDAEDGPDDTLAELDRVRWVGPAAFRRLRAYTPSTDYSCETVGVQVLAFNDFHGNPLATDGLVRPHRHGSEPCDRSRGRGRRRVPRDTRSRARRSTTSPPTSSRTRRARRCCRAGPSGASARRASRSSASLWRAPRTSRRPQESSASPSPSRQRPSTPSYPRSRPRGSTPSSS
jgi:hypothetical protein